MRQLSFKRHRFPADIIRHSVWLYARFTLSYRDVEEMLAERGLRLVSTGDDVYGLQLSTGRIGHIGNLRCRVRGIGCMNHSF